MSDATDLITTSRAPDRPHVQVHRFDDPTPGSYWRLRKAVKKDVHSHRMVAPAMAAGTVLMMKSVEMADGLPHVYAFSPHPDWIDAEAVRFHAEDLYVHWEPCPEGETVRASELGSLLREMEQTKQLMMTPAPGSAPAGLLGYDPTGDVGAPGQALATIDQINAMTLHAERMKEDAERQSAWITKHSKELSTQGSRLANFHGERASMALARAQAQLSGVRAILKTVANLKIYTGEGVEVLELRGGEPAAPDAPLTVYQEVLSLDEECLILLDQGGLDHTQVDSLVEALADPALLARLIPAERGVVLARFRNQYKEFIQASGNEAQQAVLRGYNSEMTQESRRKRLLVRDGERLYMLDADEILRHIKQLLPSAGEQSGYYTRGARWHGEEPERITRDDLDYAKAQRDQIGALDHYGQVLIMLWGLRDRGVLLDESALPRFSNWLAPSFMDRHLRLVSIDSMLGVVRPNFRAWRDTQNRYLCRGAWVAVRLNAVMRQERCPGGWSQGSWAGGRVHYERLYRPTPELEAAGIYIARAQSDANGFYVEIPAVYCGYKERPSRVNVKLRASICDGKPARAISEVLVLDRVRASDLSYYLESREQRASYAEYIDLFREARRWVQTRDANEAPLRDALRQAVVAGALPHDPDSLDDILTDAMAIARTSRRDGIAPLPGSSGHKAYVTAALNAAHAALVGNSERVALIERWAKANDRQPLRLVLSGKGGWQLYLVPTAAEHAPQMGRVAHASVAQVQFNGAAAQVEIVGRKLLRSVASEQVIHDWEWEVPREKSLSMWDQEPATRPAGASYWLAKESSFKLAYEDAAALMANLWEVGQQRLDALNQGPLMDRIEEAGRYMRWKSKGSVVRPYFRIPVGTALHSGTPYVVFAHIDALRYYYALGNAAEKERIRAVIDGIYKNPQTALEGLDMPLHDELLGLARLDACAKALRSGEHEFQFYRWVDQKDWAVPGKKEDHREYVLTSITSATQTLTPYLVPLVQGPA